MPKKITTRVMLFIHRNNIGESEELREYFEKTYNVLVDKYTYGGCFDAKFNNGGTIIVGRYCSIAENVHYFAANHPMELITTSAYFFNRSFSKLPVKDVERGTLIMMYGLVMEQLLQVLVIE